MLCELVLAAAMFLPAADGQPGVSPRSFQVIVNRSNPVSDLSRAEVSAIFMKRMRSWEDGSEIVAVDQPARSPLRDVFSRTIHEKSVAFVSRYWQRLIFAGRGIPPAVAASDEEVIAFVARNRGAIGYVSQNATLSDDVKVLLVTK
jgi:ABC-type phosphate transport system substrate-binding protein